jgi:hypothetical protein
VAVVAGVAVAVAAYVAAAVPLLAASFSQCSPWKQEEGKQVGAAAAAAAVEVSQLPLLLLPLECYCP